MNYQDIELTCRDCGQRFLFTGGEQEFFAQRGHTNQPSRCPACRAQRKARQGASGGPRFGGGHQDRGSRQMYDAVCAECGRETQVPFQPSGTRPVYCSDCFRPQRQY